MSAPITDNCTFQQWPSSSEKIVFGLNLLPKPDTTKQNNNCSITPLKKMWNFMWKYHRGALLLWQCSSLYAATPDTNKQLCRLVRSVRVSCDCGCALCCGAVRCGEDGPCLPNSCDAGERRWWALWSLADWVRPLNFTTPGRSRQGLSTVAWPLGKPPAHYVITSYWAL